MAPSLDRKQLRLGVFVFSMLGLAMVGLAGRLVFINSRIGPELAEKAEDRREGVTVMPARRGMILDRQGRIVAVSRQMPDVFVDAARVADVDALARDLGVRLNEPPQEIAKIINAKRTSRYVVVASRVDEATAEAITDLKNPAVGLTDQEVRTYPLGDSMAHVLGLVGREGHGLEGIELSQDKHLAGVDGKRATIRDARRRPLFRAEDATGGVDPVDGGHVVLTIDAEIQRATEDALKEAVTYWTAESGVGIVYAPRTGDILSMACYPSYNPQEGANVPADLRRNRAITDPVEPGSTFKPFIASGALAAKAITPEEKFDCGNGTHFFGARKVTDTHPHGVMDLKGVIAKSSNIGMTYIAERLGNKRLRETIRSFGFGELTGVELPGENAGVVYPLSFWNSWTTPSVAMGYEIGVTPLQLAAAFGALVNGGDRVKPRIVKQWLAPDGSLVKDTGEPHALGKAIQRDVARYMAQDLLASVVEEGTGRHAKLEEYRVVGKTGTAKLTYKDKKGYEPGKYLSLFMAAAPADNPEVLALIMVREPDYRRAYYGGTVAAPAVADILKRTLKYMQIPPDEEPREASQPNAKATNRVAAR